MSHSGIVEPIAAKAWHKLEADLLLDKLDTAREIGLTSKAAIAIFVVVILNGALGYLQENRAEKALAALKSLSSPRVRVIRDGRIMEVNSKTLVPGGVMLLEAGVKIAADGRLIETANLQARESDLTGEAHAVNKQAEVVLPEDAPLGDRTEGALLSLAAKAVLDKNKKDRWLPRVADFPFSSERKRMSVIVDAADIGTNRRWV